MLRGASCWVPAPTRCSSRISNEDAALVRFTLALVIWHHINHQLPSINLTGSPEPLTGLKLHISCPDSDVNDTHGEQGSRPIAVDMHVSESDIDPTSRTGILQLTPFLAWLLQRLNSSVRHPETMTVTHETVAGECLLFGSHICLADRHIYPHSHHQRLHMSQEHTRCGRCSCLRARVSLAVYPTLHHSDACTARLHTFAQAQN